MVRWGLFELPADVLLYILQINVSTEAFRSAWNMLLEVAVEPFYSLK